MLKTSFSEESILSTTLCQAIYWELVIAVLNNTENIISSKLRGLLNTPIIFVRILKNSLQ